MYLENIVFDAVDPRRTGLFWQQLLDCRQLSDGPEGFETRFAVPGGPALDLCFQPVADPPVRPGRVHLELHGLPDTDPVAAGALRLGALRRQEPPVHAGRDAGVGISLDDPEGNGFAVVECPAVSGGEGLLAAIAVDSADPARDLAFWAWLTGWVEVATPEGPALRHPGLHGPLLRFAPEPAPKANAKNPMHLDVRLEPADDPDRVAAGITARGGIELHPDWGVLPWRVYQDPSGNEFCVLPAPRA